MSEHPAEEILIAFADGAAGEALDHVDQCATCRGEVAMYRSILGASKAAETWEAQSVAPAGILDLASQLEGEEATAAQLVAELRALPMERWAERLLDSRTVGVVRALLREADARLAIDPDAALVLTSYASDIAGWLHGYPDSVLARVRADAWRERAYTLYYVGEFHEALAAVALAEEALAGQSSSDYDLARIRVMRAIVLSPLDRIPDAIPLVRESAEVFRLYGDDDRYLSAITTLALLYARTGDAQQALSLLMSVKGHARLDARSPLAAMVQQNLGVAHDLLGQPLLARQCLMDAAGRFAVLNMRAEELRAEWAIARLLVKAQLFEDALERLRGVRVEFRALRLMAEVCLASLDIAETLLVLDRADEAYDECTAVLEAFANAGLGTTQRARKGIAYLREAAEARTATVEVIRSVRSELFDLPGPRALAALSVQ